ncbi:MAG: hypothetical protein JW760_10180 [Spirochaetales bacterium]|nr:hypothetical protein [Spirochaetales bacterium]
MKSKGVLLISGSHRGRKTTTNSILDYLEKKLIRGDITVSRVQVPLHLHEGSFLSGIKDDLQAFDTLLLCFPLYFDTFPFPLIAALESLSEQSKNRLKGVKLFFILHCGLPEPTHCSGALAVCRRFSEERGCTYGGSAVIPDTGAIDGASVERNKRVRSILDAALDILQGSMEKDHETDITGKPSMHPFFFRVFGNPIMKHFARKNKADLFQKAYTQGFISGPR